MSQKILITKFNYSMPADEFKALLSNVAQPFAEVAGCIWKIWLVDEEKSEGGAVYLFNSQEALENFKASPLVASVLSHPALSNFNFRETDIVKEPSIITKAPLMDMIEA
ncbi:MAG TPA: YdhR family protein [Chitinophagaceae bacterium]